MRGLNKLPHDLAADHNFNVIRKLDFKTFKETLKDKFELEDIKLIYRIWSAKTKSELEKIKINNSPIINYFYYLNLNRLSGNNIFICTPDISKLWYDYPLVNMKLKFPFNIFVIYPTFKKLSDYTDSINHIIVNVKEKDEEFFLKIILAIDKDKEKIDYFTWKFDKKNMYFDYKYEDIQKFILNFITYQEEDCYIKNPELDIFHINEIKNPKKKKKYLKRVTKENLYPIRFIGLKYTEETNK